MSAAFNHQLAAAVLRKIYFIGLSDEMSFYTEPAEIASAIDDQGSDSQLYESFNVEEIRKELEDYVDNALNQVDSNGDQLISVPKDFEKVIKSMTRQDLLSTDPLWSRYLFETKFDQDLTKAYGGRYNDIAIENEEDNKIQRGFAEIQMLDRLLRELSKKENEIKRQLKNKTNNDEQTFITKMSHVNDSDTIPVPPIETQNKSANKSSRKPNQQTNTNDGSNSNRQNKKLLPPPSGAYKAQLTDADEERIKFLLYDDEETEPTSSAANDIDHDNDNEELDEMDESKSTSPKPIESSESFTRASRDFGLSRFSARSDGKRGHSSRHSTGKSSSYGLSNDLKMKLEIINNALLNLSNSDAADASASGITTAKGSISIDSEVDTLSSKIASSSLDDHYHSAHTHPSGTQSASVSHVDTLLEIVANTDKLNKLRMKYFAALQAQVQVITQASANPVKNREAVSKDKSSNQQSQQSSSSDNSKNRYDKKVGNPSLSSLHCTYTYP